MPVLPDRDPLLELLAFHGDIRVAVRRLDLLTRVPERVLCEGVRRFLAFVEGPLMWHDVDEELSVFPRLRALDDGERLRAALYQASRGHESMEDTLGEFLDRLDPDAPDRALLRATASDVERVLQPHLALEEQELFPLARLRFTEEDLEAVRAEMDRRAEDRAAGGRTNAVQLAVMAAVHDAEAER